jgi:hypothetical protein
MSVARLSREGLHGLVGVTSVLLVCLAAHAASAVPSGAQPRGPAGFETWIVVDEYVLVSMREAAAFRMVLPTREGEVEVSFQPTSVRSPRYHSEEIAGNGSRRGRGTPPVANFIGAVEPASGQRDFARISHRPGRAGILGLMRVAGALYDLRSEPAGSDTLLHVRQITPEELGDVLAGCALPDSSAAALDATVEEEDNTTLPPVADTSVLREIELGTEGDAPFVAQNGGVQAANAKILAIVNAINGIYETDLGLTNRVVVQRAYSGSDPYTTSDSGVLLPQFASEFSANTVVVYDDAQLFSGRDFDGNVVGRAYLSTVCRTYRYGVNQHYQQNDSYLTLIAAHEEGHNLGAGHSDSGIMAPSISLNNTSFSDQSVGEIDAYTAGVACLEEIAVGGPPILDPVGPQAVTENELLTVQLSATDPDGDPLSFQASPLPPGATLSPDGRFDYVPPFDTVGCGGQLQMEIEFRVSDAGGNQVSEIVPITVADQPTGRAPVLSDPPDRSVDEGQPLAIQLQASDPDGDTVTFSAIGLPGGALLGSSSGLFSWTPTAADVGTHPVTFVATDCVTRLSHSQTVSIEVRDVLPPHLDALSPESGAANTRVTITGQGFAGGSLEVRFGARLAPLEQSSDSTLVAVAPRQAKGTTSVEVTVVRGGTPADNALVFTYTKRGGGPRKSRNR